MYYLSACCCMLHHRSSSFNANTHTHTHQCTARSCFDEEKDSVVSFFPTRIAPLFNPTAIETNEMYIYEMDFVEVWLYLYILKTATGCSRYGSYFHIMFEKEIIIILSAV